MSTRSTLYLCASARARNLKFKVSYDKLARERGVNSQPNPAAVCRAYQRSAPSLDTDVYQMNQNCALRHESETDKEAACEQCGCSQMSMNTQPIHPRLKISALPQGAACVHSRVETAPPPRTLSCACVNLRPRAHLTRSALPPVLQPAACVSRSTSSIRALLARQLLARAMRMEQEDGAPDVAPGRVVRWAKPAVPCKVGPREPPDAELAALECRVVEHLVELGTAGRGKANSESLGPPPTINCGSRSWAGGRFRQVEISSSIYKDMLTPRDTVRLWSVL